MLKSSLDTKTFRSFALRSSVKFHLMFSQLENKTFGTGEILIDPEMNWIGIIATKEWIKQFVSD